MNLRTLRNSQGYTIDQTILIVAIIAILVTLIIITVGWNLINKTSGTKLASQFRQIEDANGQFYAAYRTWPHQSYSTPAASAAFNVRALAGDTGGLTYRPVVTNAPGNTATSVRNMIPGFRNNAGIQHNFGTGGAVTMLELTNPFGNAGTFLVLQFANVPFSEVQQAEWAIDGEQNQNYSTGRVVATAAGTDCLTTTVTGTATTTGASTLVNACYAANLIQ